jgi:hypothetical protein
MQTIKQGTILFIVVVVVLIIGWDIYAMIYGGHEATISSVLVTSAYDTPVIPFAFGFVMGHLFWRMKSNKDTNKLG